MEGTMGTTENGGKVERPLRVDQVAVRLGYTPRQVLNLIGAGDLPGAYQSRKRGHWRVPLRSVEKFIEKRARN